MVELILVLGRVSINILQRAVGFICELISNCSAVRINKQIYSILWTIRGKDKDSQLAKLICQIKRKLKTDM